MTGDRQPGRPRSEAVRQAILAAAADELTEKGYAALTVEGIAARAGAGKNRRFTGGGRPRRTSFWTPCWRRRQAGFRSQTTAPCEPI
ncbi:TetR/AcrR family transcriptional regulator [Fodinicola feengrottensis]|uniref:TetR/AcrR family transcriptional regulator n=1 Tax=Fodinicola feengrottensis TaxID=435914 RepID=UPI0024420B12|nr:helix-turn-helix domain containing protein [Fodinicola feengrottensis]